MNLKEIIFDNVKCFDVNANLNQLENALTDLLKRTYKAGVRDGFEEKIKRENKGDTRAWLSDTELCEENIKYFLGEE